MTMTGVEMIAAERKRQIEEKGYTPEHDMKYAQGLLAGASNALSLCAFTEPQDAEAKERGWKFIHYCEDLAAKKTPLECLVIAGALIAAEIDRLQHAAGNQQ